MYFYPIKAIKKPASALIITVLVITALSVVVTSLVRNTVSEAKQIGRLEDSQQAYYLAESGINQGLLAWRFNKDKEIPQGQGSITVDTNIVQRFDLTNNTTSTLSNPASFLPSLGQRVYDLKVYYQTNRLGRPNFLTGGEWQQSPNGDPRDAQNFRWGKFIADYGKANRVYKDQSREFDVTGLAGYNVNVYWTPPRADNNITNNYGGTTDDAKPNYTVELEIKLMKVDANGNSSLYCAITNETNCPQYFITDPSLNNNYNPSAGWNDSSKHIFTYQRVEADNIPPGYYQQFPVPAAVGGERYLLILTPKIGNLVGLGYAQDHPDDAYRIINSSEDIDKFIFFQLQSDSTERVFDSGLHYVESTGYFNGVKRKIISTIDRKSGSVLGIGNYVLYGSDSGAGITVNEPTANP